MTSSHRFRHAPPPAIPPSATSPESSIASSPADAKTPSVTRSRVPSPRFRPNWLQTSPHPLAHRLSSTPASLGETSGVRRAATRRGKRAFGERADELDVAVRNSVEKATFEARVAGGETQDDSVVLWAHRNDAVDAPPSQPGTKPPTHGSLRADFDNQAVGEIPPFSRES